MNRGPVARLKSSNLDRRLWISAALNITITLVELTGGLLAGSLALLADAMHNFADAGALGIAIFARWLGWRSPTPRHTYGFKRAESWLKRSRSASRMCVCTTFTSGKWGRGSASSRLI